MGDAENLSIMILAGGLGTRLRSVCPDLPKVICEFHGRPFLTYLLDQLLILHPKEVVLCTGYKAELVRKKLGNEYKTIHLKYSEEKSSLGTGGAVRLGMAHCEGENILAMNGDSYCDINAKEFVRAHKEKNAEASIVIVRVDDVSRYGSVKFGEDGRVNGFLEKGKLSGEGWINAGWYLFKKKVICEIVEGKKVSLEKDVFPKLIERGFFAYRTEGKFIDIGTPESYFKTEKFLIEGV